MHCIEIKSRDIKEFKNKVGTLGAKVSIVSRYVERGVTIADIEVSKDSKSISNIENKYVFKG